MKEGLIRLTDEKDIFYDSIERVYRLRQHCPQCGIALANCQCYNDLDELLGDIDDGIADYTCSSKCALIIGEWDDLHEAMQALGLDKDYDELIKGLTNERIVDYLTERFKECRLEINFNLGTREQLLKCLKENNLEDDILDEFEVIRGKSIEELTEEEATEVLDILTEDCDFDMPHGKNCIL